MFELDARRSADPLAWWYPVHLRAPLAASDADLRATLRAHVMVTEGPERPAGGHTLVSDEVTEDELREAYRQNRPMLSVRQLREALADVARVPSMTDGFLRGRVTVGDRAALTELKQAPECLEMNLSPGLLEAFVASPMAAGVRRLWLKSDGTLAAGDAKALVGLFEATPALEALATHRVPIDAETLRAWARHPPKALRGLLLQMVSLANAGDGEALRALALEAGLRRLVVHHANLGDGGARELFEGARPFEHLEGLSLSESEVGDAGVRALATLAHARGLPALRRLRIFGSDGRRVSDDGALALAASGLERLSLLDLGLQNLTHVGANALLSGALTGLRHVQLRVDTSNGPLQVGEAGPAVEELVLTGALASTHAPRWAGSRVLASVRKLRLDDVRPALLAPLLAEAMPRLERLQLRFGLAHQATALKALRTAKPAGTPRLVELSLGGLKLDAKHADALAKSPLFQQLRALLLEGRSEEDAAVRFEQDGLRVRTHEHGWSFPEAPHDLDGLDALVR
ncbi:MAG: hypothetical protein U0324_03795 [Polyangiales bacterium]